MVCEFATTSFVIRQSSKGSEGVMASNVDNTDNSYWADVYSNMAAFDRLPKAVRQALANSDHNWSARQALVELKRPRKRRKAQCMNATALAEFIRQSDKAKHERDAAAGIVAP
jgi:hypothetical protein